MKKQMIQLASVTTSVRTILGMFLAVVLVVASASGVQAKEVPNTKPVISYLGKVNEQPIVLVEFENKDEKPCQVTIHDTNGVLLYTTDFSGKKFSKKFQIAQDEPDDVKLILTVYAGKTKETQVVELSTTSYVKEEFSVSKL